MWHPAGPGWTLTPVMVIINLSPSQAAPDHLPTATRRTVNQPLFHLHPPPLTLKPKNSVSLMKPNSPPPTAHSEVISRISTIRNKWFITDGTQGGRRGWRGMKLVLGGQQVAARKRKTSLGAEGSLIYGVRPHPHFCLGEFREGPVTSVWRSGAELFTSSFSKLEDSRSELGSQPCCVYVRVPVCV